MTKSPLFSHIAASVQGLSTIRERIFSKVSFQVKLALYLTANKKSRKIKSREKKFSVIVEKKDFTICFVYWNKLFCASL